MSRFLRVGSLILVFSLFPVRAGSFNHGPPPDHPVTCADLAGQGPVPIDLATMRSTLAELTRWDVAGWEPPRIDQLLPEAFEARTKLNSHRYLGEYNAETNTVFVNLACRCHAPDHSEAFCRGVLFHELVHWGQRQSGVDRFMTGREQEHQALEYEIQFLETRLGVRDAYPPRPPTRDDLPPLDRPIRLTRFRPRAAVQDAAGGRQWIWIITGTWSEVPTLKDYLGQAISHRGRWVGLEIFEVSPSGPERVESWWDAGYAERDRTFPANPVYTGRWVRTR
jgi:hypothetical protein